jgi:hypothetical protein
MRDARGLARALTGDTLGAITDLQFAVEQWQEARVYDSKDGAQREIWISYLEEGLDPFDEATLRALRSER